MYWFHDQSQTEKSPDNYRKALWKLADNGWRIEFRKYVDRKVDDLNTPSFQRLQKLAEQTLGIRDIGANWKSGRFDRTFYALKLDKYLDIRHEIAHGNRGSENVGKKIALDAISLVEKLAGWMSIAIRENEENLKLGPNIIE